MKKIFFAIIFAVSALCFGENAQSLKIRIENLDASSLEKTVKLERQADGAMRLVIPAKEITRGIKNIDIQHPAFTAKVGDNGYWLGNRGQIGFFKYNKGTWTTAGYNNHHLIPIQAFKTDKGMFLAWLKGLRFEVESRVDVKDGKYNMFYRLRVADMLFDAYEDLVIDYYDLGKDAQYSEVGRFFRNKRLAAGEIIPLSQKMKTLPNAEYQKDTFVTRLHVFASKPRTPGDQTPETEPKVKVFMTTKQAEDIMRACKAAGIEKMEFCCAGWTTGGYDGRFPSLFPVEESIGGEAGFKKMVETAKSLGYTISCHTANTGAYKISPMWSPDYICKKPDGSLLRGETYWAGGNTYRVCLERAWQLYIPQELLEVKKLGVNGVHYIDVFTAIAPYPCCDKNHPANRKQSAQAQQKIARFCIDNLGGFSSECGEDHLINDLIYINYVSHDIINWQGYGFVNKKLKNFDDILPLARPERSRSLIDQVVPLWEIIYHGFVYHNADRVTQNHTTLYAKRISKKLPLLLVEFGARPIIYTNSIKSVDKIAKAYRQYQAYSRLSTVFMDYHKIINKDVRLIGYADGTRIVVNYGDRPYQFEGVEIGPISYKLFDPKK